MNDTGANAVGVVIIVLMVTFLAIWVWAWLPYHKRNFELLARMPMLDALPPGGSDSVTKEGAVPSEDSR